MVMESLLMRSHQIISIHAERLKEITSMLLVMSLGLNRPAVLA